jgi:hypothetical protein
VEQVGSAAARWVHRREHPPCETWSSAIHVGPGLETWSDAPWDRYFASKNIEAFCDELDRTLERSPASVDDIAPADGAARVLSYPFIAAALQSSLTSTHGFHCVSVAEPEFGGDVIPPPSSSVKSSAFPTPLGIRVGSRPPRGGY